MPTIQYQGLTGPVYVPVEEPSDAPEGVESWAFAGSEQRARGWRGERLFLAVPVWLEPAEIVSLDWWPVLGGIQRSLPRVDAGGSFQPVGVNLDGSDWSTTPPTVDTIGRALLRFDEIVCG